MPSAGNPGDDQLLAHIAQHSNLDAGRHWVHYVYFVLKDAMLSYDERGPVASLRTQARGHDVGAGDQDAVRVVDLLNRNGRRLAQADVWRTEAGAWRAGVWSQCID